VPDNTNTHAAWSQRRKGIEQFEYNRQRTLCLSLTYAVSAVSAVREAL